MTSTTISSITDQIDFWTEEKRKYQHNLNNGDGHVPSILTLLGEIDTTMNKYLMMLNELKSNDSSSLINIIDMTVTNLEEEDPLITQNVNVLATNKSKTTKLLFEGCLIS